MTLLIVEPGMLTSVQDSGRKGYTRFGVPCAGAMDWFALHAANQLVGNPPDAAVLEFFSGAPPAFSVDEGTLLAVAGAGFVLSVDGIPIPRWMAFWVRAGQSVWIKPQGAGCWGVIAVAGGIDTPLVLGSRSTHLRSRMGGLEGRLLRAGDRLPLGAPCPGWKRLAGRSYNLQLIPAYASEVTLEVILGPQVGAFTPVAVETLLSARYAVSSSSDRMGYRLEGPRLEHLDCADILSEGTAAGSLQVPGNGQPVLLLSDRQVTGGYAKIATVISADLPLAVQCQPGVGKMNFKAVDVAYAQERLRRLVARMAEAIDADDFGSGGEVWI